MTTPENPQWCMAFCSLAAKLTLSAPEGPLPEKNARIVGVSGHSAAYRMPGAASTHPRGNAFLCMPGLCQHACTPMCSSAASRSVQIEKKHILKGHAEAVQCVLFSPDSVTLASGSDDKTVRWGSGSSQSKAPSVQLLPHCAARHPALTNS
jgi:WD40 repeat protein